MTEVKYFFGNSPKKIPFILFGIVLGLAVFFLVRSCSSTIMNQKVYHIGQDSKWENLNLMGKERNFAAFNNQLLKAIAKEEDVQISILLLPSFELISDLEQGKLEGILTSLEPSYLNDKSLVFSNPFFLTGPVLVIRAPEYNRGEEEKPRKIIAIPYNSPLLSSLEEDPKIHTKFYTNVLSAFSDLEEGRIDGAIFPAIISHAYVNAFYKDILKVATLPLTDEGIRLVAKRNEEGLDLIDRFDHGLAVIKQNGELGQLLNRWGLFDVETIQ